MSAQSAETNVLTNYKQSLSIGTDGKKMVQSARLSRDTLGAVYNKEVCVAKHIHIAPSNTSIPYIAQVVHF